MEEVSAEPLTATAVGGFCLSGALSDEPRRFVNRQFAQNFCRKLVQIVKFFSIPKFVHKKLFTFNDLYCIILLVKVERTVK